jgi:hypothetical protein
MTNSFLKRKLLFLVMTLPLLTGFGQAGNVPVTPPINGFAIDGFLQRQTAGTGDWLAGPGGNQAGTFILTDAGSLAIPLFGFFHVVDVWDNSVDDVFASNARLNDNPNTMRWTLKRANPRNDINHGIIFFTQNPDNGHIWAIVSGDRFGNNGTNTLDFEFLQNPVIQIPPGTNNQGGFVSLGPHHGRTVGDLVVSIEFAGEGSFGSTSISQWQPGAIAGEYEYFNIGPPPGVVYAAFNAGPVAVPYGAFGSTTYPTLTFGEAAIDMTGLIGGTVEGCNTTTPFRTLWIKSRSSSSPNAQLQDFVGPLQIPYTIVGYDVSVSVTPLPGLDQFQLTASVSPGTVEDYTFQWTALQGNPPGGTLDNPNIYNPIFSLTDSTACGNFSYEVEVRLKSTGCVVAKKTVVIRIPCKVIGKPINPDRANLDQALIRENANGKIDVTVYPNPAKGSATIILPNDNYPSDVELLDIKGAIVQRWKQLTTNILTFKNIPTGIYILKIVTPNGTVTTKKIMIAR